LKTIGSIKRTAAAIAAGLSLAIPGSIVLAASTAAAAPAHPSAASGASLPKITVAMNGKKITVGGDLQSGAVRIVSTVTGERQGEPVFVRLDPGITPSQFLKVLPRAAADPNNVDGFASIVVDTIVSRGHTSTIQANLKPGEYIALDVAHNGLPPLTPFTIIKAASPAKLPAPKATVSAIEFGFRGSGMLHKGQLVRFANHGFLVHMIDFGRARSAADARKAARLLRQGKLRQVGPLLTGGGTFLGPVSHGAFQQLVIHNRPGYYVLACFMETQDGRDHIRLGMERVIRIVK